MHINIYHELFMMVPKISNGYTHLFPRDHYFDKN